MLRHFLTLRAASTKHILLTEAVYLLEIIDFSKGLAKVYKHFLTPDSLVFNFLGVKNIAPSQKARKTPVGARFFIAFCVV